MDGEEVRISAGTTSRSPGGEGGAGIWSYMVLEKTLESPLTARRSNQSILKEINPEYSLKRLILKLKEINFYFLSTPSLWFFVNSSST